MKAIDLFAGAGGLSLGMKQASWEVVGALEIWPEALATHRVNMPDVAHICDDIRDVDFTAFRGVDLVAGGPPCQPFSVSGKQLGAGDVRDMLPEFLRAVEEARPDDPTISHLPCRARRQAQQVGLRGALEGSQRGGLWRASEP